MSNICIDEILLNIHSYCDIDTRRNLEKTIKYKN